MKNAAMRIACFISIICLLVLGCGKSDTEENTDAKQVKELDDFKEKKPSGPNHLVAYISLITSLTSLACIIMLLRIFERWTQRKPEGSHYLQIPDKVSDQIESSEKEFKLAKEQFNEMIKNIKAIENQMINGVKANQ